MINFLSHPNLLELNEVIIKNYEELYDEKKNIFLKDEIIETEKFEVIPFKEPNIVQKEALEVLEKSRKERGIKSGLVVMATGLGKTILAALDVAQTQPKNFIYCA